MNIAVDPNLFHDFHMKVAMPLKLPPTARLTVEKFVDIDVTAEAVAKILQHNQYFEQMLLQEIRNLGMKDNTPALQGAIALLGMTRARDFILALSMVRTIGRRHPKVGEDGKFDFKPAEYLSYAQRTEEYAGNRKLKYVDTAYAAGMLFDLMTAIGRETFKAEKEYDVFVNEIYKHGLRAAAVGMELAKHVKSFTFTKFVFSACLVHDVGKLAMELLYPKDYASFRNDVTKTPTSSEIIHFIEQKRFGLTHEFYSSEIAYYYDLFRPFEKALLFHHDPYLIQSTGRDIYTLASIITLASNVADNFRIPKDTTDPVVKSWLSPSLGSFRVVTPQQLVTIMAKVGRETF